MREERENEGKKRRDFNQRLTSTCTCNKLCNYTGKYFFLLVLQQFVGEVKGRHTKMHLNCWYCLCAILVPLGGAGVSMLMHNQKESAMMFGWACGGEDGSMVAKCPDQWLIVVL